MKRQYLTVLFILICVLGFGLGAHAQEEDTVVTKAPFDFVAGGKVFPAGSYRVSRVDNTTGSRMLQISSYEPGAGVFLLPTVFDDVQSTNAQLNFEHVGDKYFLSGIETPIGTYALTVPRSAIKLAQTQQQSASSSGSN
jgi:hypothetical protein